MIRNLSLLVLLFSLLLPIWADDKNYQASEAAIALIKSYEGFRNSTYSTSSGTFIGYGFSRYPDGSYPKAGDSITEERANEILNHELTKISNYISKILSVKVKQHQFDALVSFAYSVGLGRFERSTLFRYVNSKEFDLAAGEFQRWVHVGGVASPGLVKRRTAEQKLFTQGA